MKDSYVDFTDLENIKKALENAEIDYEELNSIDGDDILLETDSVQFHFTSKGELLNIEPFKLSVQ